MVYGALGVRAVQLLRGLGGPAGDQTELWTAKLLDWPLGPIVVAMVGGVIAAYGTSQFVQAVTASHDRKVEWASVPSAARLALQRVSQFGVATRGGLLVTLGVFLLRAGLTRDADQAAGTRESLVRLGGLFEGRWFLAVLAVGVIAYAVDQAVHAWCRRIRPVT
jgi:hypothetical protein